jgi:hypothetical protein
MSTKITLVVRVNNLSRETLREALCYLDCYLGDTESFYVSHAEMEEQIFGFGFKHSDTVFLYGCESTDSCGNKRGFLIWSFQDQSYSVIPSIVFGNKEIHTFQNYYEVEFREHDCVVRTKVGTETRLSYTTLGFLANSHKTTFGTPNLYKEILAKYNTL